MAGEISLTFLASNDVEDVERMFQLGIYVAFVRWWQQDDRNHLMNDQNCRSSRVVQVDRRRKEEPMMMCHFCHVWVYSKRNSFHISNTKISVVRRANEIHEIIIDELTLTILAFFNVLLCSTTCLILSQFSTCHRRISQSWKISRGKTRLMRFEKINLFSHLTLIQSIYYHWLNTHH